MARHSKRSLGPNRPPEPRQLGPWRRGEIPPLRRGEFFCIPCRRIVRVGFAYNGEHGASAEHMAALERQKGSPNP